jgi:hypothetical protein
MRPVKRRRISSGLGGEQDDLDASGRGIDLGRVGGSGDMSTKANGGDPAAFEPTGRLDRVLVHQIPTHRIGLLLRENFGEILVVIVVGECGDDDFGIRPGRLLAPAADFV